MVLKATANDRRHLALCHGEFRGPQSGRCRSGGITTRGLLTTDHVILNHGQVTWTTSELAPPSPNYHTTPKNIPAKLKSTLPRYMAARVL
ncbi:hypothetical protein TNCV_4641431 [Trichonephila clavipes]|nr:hypothetical protein TNCV_4641431 [Trichonephila clavipes]